MILLCGGAVYAQQPATRYLSDDIPKAWTPDTLFSQQLPPEDLWWSGFNDACLDTLIQEAVDSNHNLLAAADRIRMAVSGLAYGTERFLSVGEFFGRLDEDP